MPFFPSSVLFTENVTIQVILQYWLNHRSVTVQQCFEFVHLGLRSIRVLFEKDTMDVVGVLLNSYDIIIADQL